MNRAPLSGPHNKTLVPLGLMAILIATYVIYSPLIRAGFLSWDDDVNITANPYFAIGPWSRLWEHAYYGMYVPVTSTLWYALYEIGGGSALPFRIANIVLHCVNVLLVFALIRNLGAKLLDIELAPEDPVKLKVAGLTLVKSVPAAASKKPQALAKRKQTPEAEELPAIHPDSHTLDLASLVGAAVFALHPLQAGAVAWISGGRDLLSLLFSLFAVSLFYAKKPRPLFALTFFALALLSKPQASILPLAMLVFAGFFEPKRLFLTAAQLVPWFVASFAAALTTYRSQIDVIEWITPFWQRPLVMLDSYGFYLSKLIWPAKLAADYGRSPQNILINWPVTVLHILLALAVLGAVKARKGPAKLGYIWFVLLIPTSGLVSFGFQNVSTVTDHYAYTAMAVVAVLVTLAVYHFTQSTPEGQPFGRTIATTIAVSLTLGAFTFQTHTRAQVWADERAFFEDMIAKNPQSATAYIALGTLDCIRGTSYERGLNYLEKAREARPDDPTATADYANCLFRMSKHDEVLALEQEFKNEALVTRLKGNDRATAALFVPLGGAHFAKGHLETAMEYFCQAVWRDPVETGFQQNVEMVQRQIFDRGEVKPQCPPRADLDAFIKRRLTP